MGTRRHLRFDDTNPEKEEIEYIEAIQEDIKWLGFDWGDYIYHASDYYDQLHAIAIKLTKDGLALYDSLTPEQVREYREPSPPLARIAQTESALLRRTYAS